MKNRYSVLLIVFIFFTNQFAFALDTDTVVIYRQLNPEPLKFNVEIAATAEEKSVGLMFRRSLPADSGMWFLYERPEPAAFWMKNTHIPLDIIFVKPNGIISNIHHRTTPFSEKNLPSKGAIKAVLEINAGLAKKYNIQAGDKIIGQGITK